MSEIRSAGNKDRAQKSGRIRSKGGVQRAQTKSLPRETERVEIVQVSQREMPVVRADRVAAMRAKINDVSYDVDSDFRNAMHKLLEDFGA